MSHKHRMLALSVCVSWPRLATFGGQAELPCSNSIFLAPRGSLGESGRCASRGGPHSLKGEPRGRQGCGGDPLRGILNPCLAAFLLREKRARAGQGPTEYVPIAEVKAAHRGGLLLLLGPRGLVPLRALRKGEAIR